MSMIGFVGPAKDTAAMRALAHECNGPRKSEYVEARRRVGVTKERIFLAETPMGAMVCAYGEGLNAGFQMARYAASNNAFDKFFLESLVKISGVDFAKMPAGPPPHLAFEWSNGKPGKKATMIGAPLAKPAEFWAMCREMTRRYAEHGESRERHGVTLERAFVLHDAKMVAVYVEGDDPAHGVGAVMQSSNDYDKWFADTASAVHGIDFRAGPPPAPELLVSFDA
jgi:hypothetical protein